MDGNFQEDFSQFNIQKLDNVYEYNFHDDLYSSQGYQQFCNEVNIDECLEYLSQELTTLGLGSLFADYSSTCDLVKVINALYQLLVRNQRYVNASSELEQRVIKAECEVDRLKKDKSRLQHEIERLKHVVSALQEKERQINEKYKSVIARLKLDKEENRKLLALISQRDMQYHHEIRKKEREMEKFKDKLQLQFSGRNQKKSSGIEMSGILVKTSGQREKWRTPQNHVKDMESFYKTLIKQFQDKIQLLMEENSSFRDSLFYMQKITDRYLDEEYELSEDEVENSSDDSMNDPSYSFPRDFFNMPSHQLCNCIKHKLKMKMKKIRYNINEARPPVEQDSESSSIEVAEEKPEIMSSCDCSNTEQRLSGILNTLTNTCQELQNIPKTFQSEDVLLKDCCDLDDEVLLQKKKLFFEKQKSNFEKERELFTNAAITLTKDKMAFADEKAKFEKRKFLEMEIPVLLNKSNQRCGFKVSSSGDSSVLPTTPELLKSLNLSPKRVVRGQLFKMDEKSDGKCPPFSSSCLDLHLRNSEFVLSKFTPLRKSLSHFTLDSAFDMVDVYFQSCLLG